MKPISISLLLMLVLVGSVAVARAQSYGSGGGYDDGPFVTRATTPPESIARGRADVIRAWGQYSLWRSQAAINAVEAGNKYLDNRVKWLETYHRLRRINYDRRQAERGPRPTREDIIRFAQSDAPRRLGHSQFSPVSGWIAWPILFRVEGFAKDRAKLEGLFSQRAVKGEISGDDYSKVLETTRKMKATLKQRVREVPANDYVTAKHFLRSLAHEAGQPVGFHPGVAKTP